jgi:hypothetical protein
MTLLAVPSFGSSAAAATYSNLSPGKVADLRERVPVNVVFVGFEPNQVDAAAFLAAMPGKSDPVVRSRLWYGVTERLGLHYTYDYRLTYTDAAFENSLFSALTGLARKESTIDGRTRTLYQQMYNDQQRNVLDVGTNYFIDAPTVEKWLIDHPPAGVNTREDTLFFIDWWGRPDFKFHVYTKVGEPDPDTGFDSGRNRQSRKMNAWGGTTAADEESGLGPARGTNRVWFYDLSAGPETWAENWNVDNPDLDGDGVVDYRLPASWEYRAGGFRAPSKLTGDLAKVTRYVGLDLLFTSSPLYPPALAPPRLPGSINLDVNTYEGWPGVDASTQYQTPALLLSEVSELQPAASGQDQQDLPFLGTQSEECYRKWLRNQACYPGYPYPGGANLFLDNALHLDRVRDGGGEYEALVLNYSTTDKGDTGNLSGFAEDNWIDGTQSGIFTFFDPFSVSVGVGMTVTEIHEVGHHLGLSHPHDGYDSETGRAFGPEGSFHFAWDGDKTNTAMSYISLNWDFSQFDQDNFNRFEAAAYVTNANAIAASILADPDAAVASDELSAADDEIGRARDALGAHDYAGAFAHARLAYGLVRAGAAQAGVAVPASDNGWTVLPKQPVQTRVAQRYAYVDDFKQMAKP